MITKSFRSTFITSQECGDETGTKSSTILSIKIR
jgi:hypothetical protein